MIVPELKSREFVFFLINLFILFKIHVNCNIIEMSSYREAVRRDNIKEQLTRYVEIRKRKMEGIESEEQRKEYEDNISYRKF